MWGYYARMTFGKENNKSVGGWVWYIIQACLRNKIRLVPYISSFYLVEAVLISPSNFCTWAFTCYFVCVVLRKWSADEHVSCSLQCIACFMKSCPVIENNTWERLASWALYHADLYLCYMLGGLTAKGERGGGRGQGSLSLFQGCRMLRQGNIAFSCICISQREPVEKKFLSFHLYYGGTNISQEQNDIRKWRSFANEDFAVCITGCQWGMRL